MDGNTIWANSITEHLYGFDYNQFDIDPEDNVYFGAQARDTIHFGQEYTYVNTGVSDLFVAKYTTDGQLDWVKTIQSNESSDNIIRSVKVHEFESVLVSGYFGDYLKIDEEELISTNQHGFVALLGDDIIGVEEVFTGNDKKFDIYPNPSDGIINVDLGNNANNNIVLEVFNINGELIISEIFKVNEDIRIDLSESSNGLYLVNISFDGNLYSEKFIIK
jgi:hypothetical protein